MEQRLEKQLKILLERYIQTEEPSDLIEILTKLLISECGAEIDAELYRNARHSQHTTSRSHSYASTSLRGAPEHGCRRFKCAMFNSEVDNLNIKAIANGLNVKKAALNSVLDSIKFRKFRLKILDMCNILVQNLWKTDNTSLLNKRIQHRLSEFSIASSNSNNELGDNYTTKTLVNEEKFSNSNSKSKQSIDADVLNIIGIIMSETVSFTIRKKNLRRLFSLVNPLIKFESQFDSILCHFPTIISHTELFTDAMDLISRILVYKDEESWKKICVMLSRLTPLFIYNQNFHSNFKLQYIDFLVQIFKFGPHVWQRFSLPTIKSIFTYFIELITLELSGPPTTTTKISFITLLFAVDPCIVWIRYWLQNYSFRLFIAEKLCGFENESMEVIQNIQNIQLSKVHSVDALKENFFDNDKQFVAWFQFHEIIILNSLKYEDMVCRFDVDYLKRFLDMIVGLCIKNDNEPNVVNGLLLEASMSHSGATFLAENGIDIILSLNSLFGLKILRNTLCFTKKLPEIFDLQKIFYVTKSIVESTKFNLIHNQIPFSTTTNKKLKTVTTADDSIILSLDVMALILNRIDPQSLHQLSEIIHLTSTHILELMRNDNSINFTDPVVCRIVLAPGFLHKEIEYLKLWRHSFINKSMLSATILNYRSQFNKIKQYSSIHGALSYIPHALDKLTNDERRLYSKILLNFLKCTEKKETLKTNQILRKTSTMMQQQQISQILCVSKAMDFLLIPDGAPTAECLQIYAPSRGLVISNAIFVLITQPGIGVDLLRSVDIVGILNERFTTMDSSFVEFIRRLSFITINIELIMEFCRQLNIQAKLLQVLEKYYVNTVGEPIIDELSTEIWNFLLLNSTIMTESMRLKCISTFSTNLNSLSNSFNMESINKTKHPMDDINDNQFKLKPFSSWSESFQQLSIANVDIDFIAVDEEEKELKEESTNLNINKNNLKYGNTLNGKLNEKNISIIQLLHEYLDLMEIPSNNCSTSGLHLSSKLCSTQMEWLSPFLNSAVNIGKIKSRQTAQKHCMGLRFLPQIVNESFTSANSVDCFLAAIFLASGLDAKRTNCICERLLSLMTKKLPTESHTNYVNSTNNGINEAANKKNQEILSNDDYLNDMLIDTSPLKYSLTIDNIMKNTHRSSFNTQPTFWPLAMKVQFSHCIAASPHIAYCDRISTQVYPRVIQLLSNARLQTVYNFIECVEVSLLHLLLFYLNRCYVGILEWPEVEYYILYSVMEGVLFQASHFCAVLKFISEKNGKLSHTNVNSVEFLRPYMKGFTYDTYSTLFSEIICDINNEL